VIHCLENVAAKLAGLDSTAMKPVPPDPTAKAASCPALARTVQTVTASQGSVRVHRDIWEMTAPLPAWQEPTEPIAHQFVIAKMMVRVPLWMACAIAKKGGKEWIALFHVQVEVGVLTVTRHVTAQTEQPAGQLMAFVSAPLDGKGSTVTSRVRMEHMVLIAVNVVTVATQMGVILSPVTAAVLRAGQ
ncbi:PREDICTED: uncharacterized protein LOC104487636, partial [Chlamydotis macqueenii]|uniref:uncharacterized protein LOC104487636 n=1 Tax=Chlamydotis macqueenii TaxID=187382 RepID=UPI0005298F0E